MVEQRAADIEVDDRQLSAVFGALADPTRRAIVRRLASGEATVGELAQPFAMSFQAVIKQGRRAQQRPCHLRPESLASVSGWLGDFRQLWESSFDRLDEHLTKKKGSPP